MDTSVPLRPPSTFFAKMPAQKATVESPCAFAAGPCSVQHSASPIRFATYTVTPFLCKTPSPTRLAAVRSDTFMLKLQPTAPPSMVQDSRCGRCYSSRLGLLVAGRLPIAHLACRTTPLLFVSVFFSDTPLLHHRRWNFTDTCGVIGSPSKICYRVFKIIPASPPPEYTSDQALAAASTIVHYPKPPLPRPPVASSLPWHDWEQSRSAKRFLSARAPIFKTDCANMLRVDPIAIYALPPGTWCRGYVDLRLHSCADQYYTLGKSAQPLFSATVRNHRCPTLLLL